MGAWHGFGRTGLSAARLHAVLPRLWGRDRAESLPAFRQTGLGRGVRAYSLILNDIPALLFDFESGLRYLLILKYIPALLSLFFMGSQIY